MKTFFIRWTIELLVLCLAATLILLAEPAWSIGLLFQILFLILIVILAVYTFSVEEKLLMKYLQQRGSEASEASRAINIIEAEYGRLYIKDKYDFVPLAKVIEDAHIAEINRKLKEEDINHAIDSMLPGNTR